MKYIKKFEKFNHQFKVGDYVIADKLEFDFEELENYLKNNVGQIEEVRDHPLAILNLANIRTGIAHKVTYVIKYLNIWPLTGPENLKNSIVYCGEMDNNPSGCFALYENEIRLATPEEIEHQLIINDVNKYNL